MPQSGNVGQGKADGKLTALLGASTPRLSLGFQLRAEIAAVVRRGEMLQLAAVVDQVIVVAVDAFLVALAAEQDETAVGPADHGFEII